MRPRSVNRFTQRGSAMCLAKVAHGTRGPHTSSRVSPTRHCSPTSAASTSRPLVVRFSPNIPSASSRSSSAPHQSSSSRATAYTACVSPPWCLRLPIASPTTPLPSPPRLGPGSRTSIRSTGRLRMPLGRFMPGTVSGTPALTERTVAGTPHTLAGSGAAVRRARTSSARERKPRLRNTLPRWRSTRLRAQEESRGDVLVGPSFGDQQRDPGLLGGERLVPVGRPAAGASRGARCAELGRRLPAPVAELHVDEGLMGRLQRGASLHALSVTPQP